MPGMAPASSDSGGGGRVRLRPRRYPVARRWASALIVLLAAALSPALLSPALLSAEPANAQVVGRANDAWPFSGGARVIDDRTGRSCTTGFTMYENTVTAAVERRLGYSAGAYRWMTIAGHCGQVGDLFRTPGGNVLGRLVWKAAAPADLGLIEGAPLRDSEIAYTTVCSTSGGCRVVPISKQRTRRPSGRRSGTAAPPPRKGAWWSVPRIARPAFADPGPPAARNAAWYWSTPTIRTLISSHPTSPCGVLTTPTPKQHARAIPACPSTPWAERQCIDQRDSAGRPVDNCLRIYGQPGDRHSRALQAPRSRLLLSSRR
jgi:hypothetical protein